MHSADTVVILLAACLVACCCGRVAPPLPEIIRLDPPAVAPSNVRPSGMQPCQVVLPLTAVDGLHISLSDCFLSAASHGVSSPSPLWPSQRGVVVVQAVLNLSAPARILSNVTVQLRRVHATDLCAVFYLFQTPLQDVTIVIEDSALFGVCQLGAVQFVTSGTSVVPLCTFVSLRVELLRSLLHYSPIGFDEVDSHIKGSAFVMMMNIRDTRNATFLIDDSSVTSDWSHMRTVVGISSTTFQMALLMFVEGYDNNVNIMIENMSVWIHNSTVAAVAAAEELPLELEAQVAVFEKIFYHTLLFRVDGNSRLQCWGSSMSTMLQIYFAVGKHLVFNVSNTTIVMNSSLMVAGFVTFRSAAVLYFSEQGMCEGCTFILQGTAVGLYMASGYESAVPRAGDMKLAQTQCIAVKLCPQIDSVLVVQHAVFDVRMVGGYEHTVYLLQAASLLVFAGVGSVTLMQVTLRDVDLFTQQDVGCGNGAFCSLVQTVGMVVVASNATDCAYVLLRARLLRVLDKPLSLLAVSVSTTLVSTLSAQTSVAAFNPAPTTAQPAQTFMQKSSTIDVQYGSVSSWYVNAAQADASVLMLSAVSSSCRWSLSHVTLSGQSQSVVSVGQDTIMVNTTLEVHNITTGSDETIPALMSQVLCLRGVLAASVFSLVATANSRVIFTNVEVTQRVVSALSGQLVPIDAVRSATFTDNSTLHIESCTLHRTDVVSATARVFSGTAVFSGSSGVALECNRVMLNGSRSRRLHAADVARDMTSANARTLPLTLRDCTYDITATAVLPPVPHAVVRTALPTDVYRAFAGVGVAALAASVVAASPTGRVGMLQVSSAALRIRQRCRTAAAAESSDADGGGAAGSLQSVLDNPLQLPLGKLFTDASVADAASTVIGNGVLVIVAACLNGLVFHWRALRLASSSTRVIAAITDVLPGSVAVLLGSQLQPVLSAGIFMVVLAEVVESHAVAARIVGSLTLVAVLVFATLLLRRIALVKPFPLRRRVSHVLALHRRRRVDQQVNSSATRAIYWLLFLCRDSTHWTVGPPRTELGEKACNVMELLRRYEPWFGELRDDGGRVTHLFGVVDVVVSLAAGVVSGSALASPALCSTAGAESAVLALLLALACGSLAAYCVWRPMASAFGNASAVLTQCVCVLVVVLCIAGADDAAAWIALLQSLVSCALSLLGLAFRLSLRWAAAGDDECVLPVALIPVMPPRAELHDTNRQGRLRSSRSRLNSVVTHPLPHAESYYCQPKLTELIALICAQSCQIKEKERRRD